MAFKIITYNPVSSDLNADEQKTIKPFVNNEIF